MFRKVGDGFFFYLLSFNWLQFYPGWGFGLVFEWPSDWHEEQHLTIEFAFIWGRFYFHVPWYKRYPDHYQCSGPQFGFKIVNCETIGTFNPSLFLYYGNDTGQAKDKTMSIIHGPWDWGSSVRKENGVPETHDYTYKTSWGEIQHRKATITPDEREWRRWWLPHKYIWKGIDIEFDHETGEGSGGWKGGVLACGYQSLPGETPLQTLRRMERERRL